MASEKEPESITADFALKYLLAQPPARPGTAASQEGVSGTTRSYGPGAAVATRSEGLSFSL